MKGIQIIGIVVAAACMRCGTSDKQPPSMQIDQIWAGCAAGYNIITVPPYQFVAYYDTVRYMTIAQRKLTESVWKRQRLATQVGWDTHNSIEMALDSAGFIHVSGNMHVEQQIAYVRHYPDSPLNLTGNLEMAQVNLVENKTAGYGTYVLRWETLKRNRDQPYDFIPNPQWLELYHYAD